MSASANEWLNQRIVRAIANAPRLRDDEALRRQVILGSVPTALFIPMPVFALLLKLACLGSGRLFWSTCWWRCTATPSCCWHC